MPAPGTRHRSQSSDSSSLCGRGEPAAAVHVAGVVWSKVRRCAVGHAAKKCCVFLHTKGDKRAQSLRAQGCCAFSQVSKQRCAHVRCKSPCPVCAHVARFPRPIARPLANHSSKRASKTWARHLKAKPSLHMFSKVLVHTDTLVSTDYKLRLKCTGHSTSNIYSTYKST